MKLTIIQKLRLFLIKSFLEVLTFLEFLEDTPSKIFGLLLKSLFTIFLLALFVGFLVKESENQYIYQILEYTFITRYTPTTIDLSYRYPILMEDIEFPQISARSYMIVDLNRVKVLNDFNSKTPLPPASPTKLMTALVSREIYDLGESIEIPKECVGLEDTQQIGFLVGEKILVRDLIGSLLVNSAGDSACALARGKLPYNEFINKMNAKAFELEMRSSNFTNPIGLDDFSENHLSSAYDLYLLTLAIRKDSFLKDLVATKEYDISSGIFKRKVFNTNDLLWDIPGTVGIKTGRTYGAGEVLIYEYDKDNIDLLIVVMGSLDRFKDTAAILNWTLESYDFGKF